MVMLAITKIAYYMWCSGTIRKVNEEREDQIKSVALNYEISFKMIENFCEKDQRVRNEVNKSLVCYKKD